jgi:hypothetical protein
MPGPQKTFPGTTMVAFGPGVATIEPRGFQSQRVPLLVFGSCHY